MSAPVLASRNALRVVLAEHFVMWHDLEDPTTIRGEWRCACGLKFGFSDSAIDHQADVLAGVVHDPTTLADVQIHHQASMHPSSHTDWWVWVCETCGSSGSASREGCRQAVEAHNRVTSAPMTRHMARALAAALTECGAA